MLLFAADTVSSTALVQQMEQQNPPCASIITDSFPKHQQQPQQSFIKCKSRTAMQMNNNCVSLVLWGERVTMTG